MGRADRDPLGRSYGMFPYTDAVRHWIALIVVLAIAGCGSSPDSAAPAGDTVATTEPSAVDPCAERMHDLIGGLLFHYYQYGRLPETLAEVNAPGLGLPPAVCPTSNVPYAYTPDGIRLPQRDERVILYEGAQAHGPYRWGVSASEPDAGGQLQMKVLPLPESVFLLR